MYGNMKMNVKINMKMNMNTNIKMNMNMKYICILILFEYYMGNRSEMKK